MTSTAPANTTTSIPDPATAQARILRVLVASQVLSGAGLAAGVTVGALSLALLPAVAVTAYRR
jgi:hypothetical protein